MYKKSLVSITKVLILKIELRLQLILNKQQDNEKNFDIHFQYFLYVLKNLYLNTVHKAFLSNILIIYPKGLNESFQKISFANGSSILLINFLK